MLRVTHAPTVIAGLRCAPETVPTSRTIPTSANIIAIALPWETITIATSRNVPMNSAASERQSRVESKAVSTRVPNVCFGATAGTVFTVVLVTADDFTGVVAFFAAGAFFFVEVAFLVAIYFPP